MHKANRVGRLEVVKLLVEKEANTEVKPFKGETPLDVARDKSYESVRAFVQPDLDMAWGY